jgi:hypothetical protein
VHDYPWIGSQADADPPLLPRPSSLVGDVDDGVAQLDDVGTIHESGKAVRVSAEHLRLEREAVRRQSDREPMAYGVVSSSSAVVSGP